MILRDQRLAIERFAKAKMINSILRHVAEQLGYERDEQLEKLYDKTAWFFDRKEGKKAAAYDAFKRAITWVIWDLQTKNLFRVDKNNKPSI